MFLIFSLASFNAFSNNEELTFDERNQQIAEEACKGEAFNGDCTQEPTSIVDQHGATVVKAATGALTMYAWNTLTKGFFKNVMSIFKFKFKLLESQKKELENKAASLAEKGKGLTKNGEDIKNSSQIDKDTQSELLDKNADDITANDKAINKNNEALQAKQQEKVEKKGKVSATLSKICDLAVIGSNAVVAGLQVVREKKIDDKYYKAKNKSIHAEGFYAMARTHEGKRKDHKAQHIIFTGSTICYGAALTIALIPPKINVAEARRAGIRMALSIPLALAFREVKKEREKLRDASMDAISKLGTKSVCEQNSNCFCSPSMKDHPDYKNFCLDSNFATNSEGDSTSCLDSKGKLDRNCSCLATNSCFDNTVQRYFATVSNDILSRNAKNKILSDIKNVATGQYQKTETSFEKDLAYSNKKLAQLDSLIEPTKVQNSSSFNSAKAAGLPNNIASYFSNVPPEELAPSVASSSSNRSDTYSVGASGSTKTSSKKPSNSNYFSNFMNGMNKKTASKGGVTLSRGIAQNATSNAAIRASHNGIFTTISARYQKSSYRLE